MTSRYVFVAFAHFAVTALVLKFLDLVLPSYLKSPYVCAANFLLLTVVAKLTFGFTKKQFLSEKIQPYDKAVLITGCDSGFGNALAKILDSKGFHVFASCLDVNGQGAKELMRTTSKRLQILSLDVTSDESVKNALKYVKENLGTSEFWAVVNNAGVLRGFSVELTSVAEFKEIMEINAFGIVRVTKAFLPLLRQSKGRVVNLTSFSGRLSVGHTAAYTMSKSAAVTFTECLRKEMIVWGVKVISIEPESFQTPMTSVESIVKNMENTLSTVDEEVRADYGEKYLNGYKMFMEYNTSMCSPKLYKVLNALELAISLEHPDPVYRPCRSFLIRWLYSIFRSLPDTVQDLAPCVANYVIGVPKPLAADYSS